MYFAKYIKAYGEQGINIWGVTVQNEPAATQSWDSCVYSPEEERNFLRDHLGPTLAAEGLGYVKIMIWDHNTDILIKRVEPILKDPEAAKFVWGTAFHWYGGEHFDHPQLRPQELARKETALHRGLHRRAAPSPVHGTRPSATAAYHG